jgi:Tol biopolymer transport system component
VARQVSTLLRRIFVLLAFTIVTASFLPGDDQKPAPAIVYQRDDNTWFEGDWSHVVVSPDTDWAAYATRGAVHLVSLQSGKDDPSLLGAGSDETTDVAFCGPGRLARRGKRGSQEGWFLRDDHDLIATSIPSDAALTCSSDGKSIAYFRESKRGDGIFVGTLNSNKNFRYKGEVAGLAFNADNTGVYAVFVTEDGVSSLVLVTPEDGQVKLIAGDLDMNNGNNSIGVSPDGRHIYLALASPGAPDNKARHQPNASRWLGIYEVDAIDGTRRPIIKSDEDNYDPTVARGSLYWTRFVRHKAIAAFPASGGAVHEILEGAEFPLWSPDGRRIAYIFNLDRMADGPLPMDDGIIEVDKEARRTSEPSVIVSGYHEDFTPAFSPDGRWIAFHSHRSATPVPFYESPGSTDDVYLRLAADNSAPEIRLTDFGWETGPAFWSPDGRKLMFSSWVKGGAPGTDKVWVLTLDPASGRVISRDLFPLPAQIRSAQWTAWSPNGKELAIEDNEGGEKRSLWIVGIDGSQPQKLIDYRSTTYGGLDWMPDGKSIVYSGLSGDRMQIFSIARSGGAPKQLTHDSGNLFHPKVSPDGRWIACTRMIKSEQILRRPL